MPIFAGIDPGVNGAIAIIREDGSLVTEALAWEDVGRSKPEVDVLHAMKFLKDNKVTNVCLEHVQFMGSAETSGFTAARLISIYRELLGAVKMFRSYDSSVDYCTVTPKKWQNKIIGEIEKIDKEKKDKRRKRIKAAVSEFCRKEYSNDFDRIVSDNTKITAEGMFDAVAIAHWGMQNGF